MDGWMGGWIIELMDGWMDGMKDSQLDQGCLVGLRG